ncbi:hypothetical protein CHS0354_034202 [Potamilus streckersoni]|uniref:Uncharacterized protein n=1 Tax=Potamilus streckersoni TaxID=2493646 RepID=A0AAE0T3M1_9BIVA|nr:hypothetical protein CHS0354_034202 [Potamilus streckersoni]
MEQENVVTTQAKSSPKDQIYTRKRAADTISIDTDTHAQSFCCLFHACDNGTDPRWYYPFDKGIYRMCGLCCMWAFICVLFPCSMCIRGCRDIICLVDQGCWDDTCCGRCICTPAQIVEKQRTTESSDDIADA